MLELTSWQQSTDCFKFSEAACVTSSSWARQWWTGNSASLLMLQGVCWLGHCCIAYSAFIPTRLCFSARIVKTTWKPKLFQQKTFHSKSSGQRAHRTAVTTNALPMGCSYAVFGIRSSQSALHLSFVRFVLFFFFLFFFSNKTLLAT